ncbi:MAG TPA: hypothetical protein VET23_12735 [Chitinophagaceae bacterium]|nr:hypothetical protein [Chitinophagaceae bacterium]
MKRILRRILSLFFVLASLTSYSQNLTGIWRGYFITESSDQYKFELQIEQKSNSISGVSYSYLNTVFYGKATLTGRFNKEGQSALIQEIKTVELRMSGGSNACIMKCIFQYIRSGKEEFLEGAFTSKFEKDGYGAKRGGDCGGGKVFLRKVPTSDFYIEPFLRDKLKKDSSAIINNTPDNLKPAIVNRPPVKKKAIVGEKKLVTKKISPPVVTKKSITKGKVSPNSKPPVKKTITNTFTKINTPAIPDKDSIQKIDLPVVKQDPIKQIIPTPDVLKNRENALVKTLIVNDPNITIKLYDNGIVDDDSICVYLDKKLVVYNRRLSEVPITYKFKLDDDNTDHELIMVAVNLGRIPPNTSLMIVEAGDQRFDVHITSTEQRNAVVRFRYQKPK